MTSWFYQSVVQLLGHWPYAFSIFAALPQWIFEIFFCFSHVSVYVTSLGSTAVYPYPEGCLCKLVFWFDHRVRPRNVKFTFILFTCCFNCRGCSSKQSTGQLCIQIFYFLQMFLICTIKVFTVPNLCGHLQLIKLVFAFVAVVLSFLGRNLKPVNSTWLGLHHLVINFRKVGALNADCHSPMIRNYALG